MSLVAFERFTAGVGFFLSQGFRRIGFVPDGSGHLDAFIPAPNTSSVAIATYLGAFPVVQGETNEALWERVNPKPVPRGALLTDC